MNVEMVKAERLVPNEWNANHMPDAMYTKLRAWIQSRGFAGVIVARPHPKKKGKLEIVDGEHRWRIARELEIVEVPVVVQDVDDETAKILGVNLNELKGNPEPHRMAALVHGLLQRRSIEDLETLLPYPRAALNDYARLMKVPDGLSELLGEESSASSSERPTSMVFAVRDAAAIEAAIKAAKDEAPGISRGDALSAMAREYVERRAR